ncbi:MAG: LysE family translocator, partial [Muribaculaceae bacterium]|nr:LysE family translocator [Muribaculaceae bacterium]
GPVFAFIHYVSGYASIVIGAIFWWFSITYSVNKVRSHFNVRSLWLVNRIIGGLLIIFSIAGAVTGINDLLG